MECWKVGIMEDSIKIEKSTFNLTHYNFYHYLFDQTHLFYFEQSELNPEYGNKYCIHLTLSTVNCLLSSVLCPLSIILFFHYSIFFSL